MSKMMVALLAEAILNEFDLEHDAGENSKNFRKAETLVMTIASEAVKDFKNSETFRRREERAGFAAAAESDVDPEG